MKPIIIVAVALFFIHTASAQTISAKEAKNYEGKTVTVCGKVAQAVFTTSKTTLLYFDQPSPNHSFEVHIFNADISKFSYAPSEFLNGKTICITGEVTMFKEKPEIRAKSEDQIKIK